MEKLPSAFSRKLNLSESKSSCSLVNSPDSAWTFVDGGARNKASEISWSIPTDHKHSNPSSQRWPPHTPSNQSQTREVMIPLDDLEVAAFAPRHSVLEGDLRRTPRPPGMPAETESSNKRSIEEYYLHDIEVPATSPEGYGYNAWTGSNIMPGIGNRNSILGGISPFKAFRSPANTPQITSLSVFAHGGEEVHLPTPKRSVSSPIQLPSPTQRKSQADRKYSMGSLSDIANDTATGNQDSPTSTMNEFVQGIFHNLYEQDGDEEDYEEEGLDVLLAGAGLIDSPQDEALGALRNSLLRSYASDAYGGGMDHEAASSYDRDKEQPENNDRPMTPRTKASVKEFIREFRKLERTSAMAARDYAQAALEGIPDSARWRVHLELADSAKRLNLEDIAAKEYKIACSLEPTASKGWLEWSKMQDECGNTEMALDTVLDGIKARKNAHCGHLSSSDQPSNRFDEILHLRALRLYEKQNRLKHARKLIHSVCSDQANVDKIWRILFEGAQIEFRAGNTGAARSVFSFLMRHVPWYGPVYSEAFRLEESGRHVTSCLKIIRRGLHEIHRYGPLWFGLLRVTERLDVGAERRKWAMRGTAPQLPNVKFYLQQAVQNISRELVWKIYFEMGQIEERAASMAAQGRVWFENGAKHNIYNKFSHTGSSDSIVDMATARIALVAPARAAYLDSLIASPPNLRWKVLLAGAHMELTAGRGAISRLLLEEAMSIVPTKSRAYVFLECSRLEEFLGNCDVAREILVRGRQDMPGEWKICLEIAMHEARRRNFIGALGVLVTAVDQHSNAGRLWALLIQLFASAWSSDCKETKLIMCDMLERTQYLSMFCECIGIPKSKLTEACKISANSVIFQSSIDTVGATDTDKSCEFIKSFDSTALHRMCEMSRVSLFESNRQMRRVRRLVIRFALDEVPKSGEVWCEAAKCAMNPMDFISEFDLSMAHRYLSYAILFTPQYGDSFVERIRLELLCQVILPSVLLDLGISPNCFYKLFFKTDVPDAAEDLKGSFTASVCNHRFVVRESSQAADNKKNDVDATWRVLRRQRITEFYSMNQKKGFSSSDFKKVVLSKLCRSCLHADPNYGSMWFYCREKSADDSAEILGAALNIMVHELCGAQDIYTRAVSHFIYKAIKVYYDSNKTKWGKVEGEELFTNQQPLCCLKSRNGIAMFLKDYEMILKEMEMQQELRLHHALSTASRDIHAYELKDDVCAEVWSGMYFPVDFSCALIEMSKKLNQCDQLSVESKRKQIFCTDQVLP